MLPTLSNPLRSIDEIIESVESSYHQLGIEPLGVLRMGLRESLDQLRKLRKVLAAPSGAAKILLVTHGDLGKSSKLVTVKAVSVPLKVFTVDHRLGVVRPVEVEQCTPVATEQDFAEAVQDEMAEYTQVRRLVSESELKRIIEALS